MGFKTSPLEPANLRGISPPRGVFQILALRSGRLRCGAGMTDEISAHVTCPMEFSRPREDRSGCDLMADEDIRWLGGLGSIRPRPVQAPPGSRSILGPRSVKSTRG